MWISFFYHQVTWRYSIPNVAYIRGESGQHINANELIRNIESQLHQTDRYRQHAPKFLFNATDPVKAADPAPAAAQAIIDHFPAIWRVERRNERWTIETFNIHQRRLEHLESTPQPNAPGSSCSQMEPGQHAAHLLRRTPPGTSQLYQDNTVQTRLAELEREATKKAATPNTHVTIQQAQNSNDR